MPSTIEPWKELSRETVFQKYSRIIEKVMFRLPNGVESGFYIKKEGLAVAILALTPDNHVVLTRQYRPGPNEVFVELPGGLVDGTESLRAQEFSATAREALRTSLGVW